jgi:D-amino-acid dehydrogenase
MKIHIIGSGIIGLFSAYYLVKEGHDIHVIEKSDGLDGCSFENAGMIVPSHFIPLAAPGMVLKGLKWMFDSSSPFYIKPRLDFSLMQWALKFAQSATNKKVDEASPVLKDFLLYSQNLYRDIVNSKELDIDFERNGLLLLCKTEHLLEDEINVAQKSRILGLKAEILNREQVHQKEPEILPDVLGGVFYPEDAHCNPQKLIKNLKAFLISKNVKFSYATDVVDVIFSNNKISKLKVKNAQNYLEEIKTEQVILATGSWSGEFAKKMRLKLLMQGGKGYSFSQNQEIGKQIKHPTILCEAKVAVTPFLNNSVRFAGTMELSGLNQKIEMKRVGAIAKAGRNFYPNIEILRPEKSTIWQGLRPCSPDGLPYIGKTDSIENLIIATGHAMLGISLGAATGKSISDFVANKKQDCSMELFNPNRFG